MRSAYTVLRPRLPWVVIGVLGGMLALTPGESIAQSGSASDLTTGYWTGEKPNTHPSLAESWATYRFHESGVWEQIFYYQDDPGEPYRKSDSMCGPWSWIEEGETFALDSQVRSGVEEGRVLGPDRIEVNEITLNAIRERSTTTWTYERTAENDAPERFPSERNENWAPERCLEFSDPNYDPGD